MTAILEQPAPRRAERRRPLAAPPARVEQFVATVIRADATGVEIRTGLTRRPAKRALSCLLDVATGDTVLCAGADRDAAWILHVLERPEAIPARIMCPADATIESADGRLRLNADALEIVTQQFDVIAGSVKMVGNALRNVFERISQFSTSYVRHTEGLDRVQAKDLEMRASGLARVSAEHTLFEGEKLVKTRGAQIHFG